MGLVSNNRGLQTRVSRNAILDRHTENLCVFKRLGYFNPRNKYSYRKRCYRTCSPARCSNRFLQYVFSSPQKERDNETSNKSQTPQQVSQENTFQNGHSHKSIKLSKNRRLGHFSGSKRCLFTHPNFSEASQVSQIFGSEPVLSVESSLFRTNFGSESLYKNGFRSSGFFENSKCKTSSISRRLASSQSKQESIISRSKEMSRSPKFTRFSHQQRKIKSSANSKLDILRGAVSFGQGTCLPNSGKNRQIEYGNTNSFIRECSVSISLPTITRHNGILHRVNSECTLVHETYSTTSSLILETKLSGSVHKDPSYTTSEITSQLVEKFSKHAELPIFPTGSDFCHHNDRCFQNRVWGFYEQSNFSRGMVRNAEQETYKFPRIGSSVFNAETLPKSVERSICSDKIGQYHSGPIYKQTRGDEIAHSLLPNMGFMESSNSKQYSIEGCSYNGKIEHFSRPTQSNQNSTHGMVSEQTGGSKSISNLGDSSHRFICLNRQSSDRNFLFMDPTSESFSSGCFDNFMGENVRLCLSPNLSDPKSLAIYEAVPVSDFVDSSPMATETLVPRAATIIDSSPHQDTSNSGIVMSTENSDLSSQSTSFQADCMASINERFTTEGFSKGVRELLSASWRKGTQKDYCSKFRRFNSWCSTRKIDPYKISLSQIADFLSYLFDSGLQYRTIAGYRSMLSTVLPPIDNFQIGQHPKIIRLIKGVFNTRPPVAKLLPEWDLHIVLRMLENSPFDNVEQMSLKDLTLKTVFLTAITTFRRCSDLQALRTDEGSMRIQTKGITFIRHGLAKQDREKHFGAKIFVPTYTENTSLDPRKSLLQYLDKTKPLRKKLQQDQRGKLFLALCEPHKPVTSQTISHWIVQINKQAYSDSESSGKGKIHAHSTRAIGSTWAFFKGASINSILESADWSSESTISRFYLRELDVNVLQKID